MHEFFAESAGSARVIANYSRELDPGWAALVGFSMIFIIGNIEEIRRGTSNPMG
jgi:hypothetical protein